MIRGTTPTVTHSLPVAGSTIEQFRLYFMQGSETILTKDEDDCTLSGNTASVTLTQEETFLFSSKKRLEVKCRYRQANGTVGGTTSEFFTVEDTGSSEVITETTGE